MWANEEFHPAKLGYLKTSLPAGQAKSAPVHWCPAGHK